MQVQNLPVELLAMRVCSPSKPPARNSKRALIGPHRHSNDFRLRWMIRMPILRWAFCRTVTLAFAVCLVFVLAACGESQPAGPAPGPSATEDSESGSASPVALATTGKDRLVPVPPLQWSRHARLCLSLLPPYLIL